MEGTPGPSHPDDQSSLIARFVGVTDCPEAEAQFYLDAAGDFDRAVSLYYDHAVSPERARPAHVADTPPRPRAPAGPGSNGGPPPLVVRRGLLARAASIPGSMIRLGLAVVASSLRLTGAVLNSVASVVLPGSLMHRLRGAVKAISDGHSVIDPVTAARHFQRSFTAANGERHPHFVELGWQEAALAAHRQYRFLLVYLHSPEHEDTARFCAETLCDAALAEHVDRNYVAWGGDIRRTDAFRLAASLRASAYPYVALLAFSGARTRLIVSVQGYIGPAELLEALVSAANEHGAELIAEQAEASERDYSRQLRREQDDEYQAALEADRAAEAARAKAAAQQEAAAQAAADEEARLRAEAEEAAAARAAQAAELERRRASKAQSLPEEPPAGAPGTALVRVRLPNGQNFQRRFRDSAPMQDVYDFVDSLDALTASKYVLASNFPRRLFTPDLLAQPLAALDLAPQALLFVQPDDD